MNIDLRDRVNDAFRTLYAKVSAAEKTWLGWQPVSLEETALSGALAAFESRQSHLNIVYDPFLAAVSDLEIYIAIEVAWKAFWRQRQRKRQQFPLITQPLIPSQPQKSNEDDEDDNGFIGSDSLPYDSTWD